MGLIAVCMHCFVAMPCLCVGEYVYVCMYDGDRCLDVDMLRGVYGLNCSVYCHSHNN
jgi:hypothetical protein